MVGVTLFWEAFIILMVIKHYCGANTTLFHLSCLLSPHMSDEDKVETTVNVNDNNLKQPMTNFDLK